MNVSEQHLAADKKPAQVLGIIIKRVENRGEHYMTA